MCACVRLPFKLSSMNNATKGALFDPSYQHPVMQNECRRPKLTQSGNTSRVVSLEDPWVNLFCHTHMPV